MAAIRYTVENTGRLKYTILARANCGRTRRMLSSLFAWHRRLLCLLPQRYC
jgi:hypothetical protein